ncbi:MAG: hypothetical protein PF517_00110 [Salinivirgaceae bacterium]|nr:hypothetical protein [Salinivirgaceae bacterium]
MTGGAGHVKDMQSRMKQNRSMQASQKSRFGSKRSGTIHHQTIMQESKPLSEESKNKIRAIAKKERRKDIVKAIVTITVLIIAAILVYFSI